MTTPPEASIRPFDGPSKGVETLDFSVVGIGASAGGLEACRKLLDVLPENTGMAFVLVQHLDPNHDSLLVSLLASHTKMNVLQVKDGMLIEPNHLYVIPPGAYLSVAKGFLHISPPQARHGARLPFDYFLQTLALNYGDRAICVVLSGTGADGSLGSQAVKAKGGHVIAQEPSEAGFDGMPKSAIATGAVNFVLRVARIPDALQGYAKAMPVAQESDETKTKEWMPEIIELLRTNSNHDFTHYKPGTLQRRTERRMALVAIVRNDMGRYLELLRTNPAELGLLATDLLINVTNFFRDPKVFDHLAKTVIYDLVCNHEPDHPIRIWSVGCSTGEEVYSLAMVFQEQIAASKSNAKIQIFASDVDADAVATARDGYYPDTIEADVSTDRLARFFTKEKTGYRVSRALRSSVVLSVQNVLIDPPFARLDMISCRNMMIYLRPEAQAKVIAMFHFALRANGILLLGSAETTGDTAKQFEIISKSDRLYRRIGRNRPGELQFLMGTATSPLVLRSRGIELMATRPTTFAELCQKRVMANYAPAAVLINLKFECLYSLGPTDDYLTLAPGLPSNDILTMAREGVRSKLRSAIQMATQGKKRVVVGGGRMIRRDTTASFSVAVDPLQHEGVDLLLVCFIDEPKPEANAKNPLILEDTTRVSELERELVIAKTELELAIRDLEHSNEEQKLINEEASSISEEYQSANEELLTSKEELQSLNEELNALNTQLHETLDRQKTDSNDLQNVLYSTDVATIFLDPKLKIRLFTPATKLLFNVIPTDIGRPLADLHSLAADTTLLADANTVWKTHEPIEREIEAKTGAWYIRRILPYRTREGAVEGVVITFADITTRRHIADALEIAERKAQIANLGKSRFLAAASHDLRQPLQTLVLLHEMLAKAVAGDKAQKLVGRLNDTVGAMTGMLNALLDINQIEAGTVVTEKVMFPINELLQRLAGDFGFNAQAQGLELHMVPCSLEINSDPRLLDQMVRNLLSNALKYTKSGKILLGCRRRKDTLSIEVWDTGIGIPATELGPIFDEYHQLDNVARERTRGLGLGLSIVKRLGDLLGHSVHVQSVFGKGSGFAIDVQFPFTLPKKPALAQTLTALASANERSSKSWSILVVEDDPSVCELLELLLQNEGHKVASASDGVKALAIVADGQFNPDIIISDFNLPNGLDGLQVAAKMREKLHRQLPVIILTGNISAGLLREISSLNCVHINKPVKLGHLTEVIEELLMAPQAATAPQTMPPATTKLNGQPIIYVVDDDLKIREAMCSVFADAGHDAAAFETCEAFLAAFKPGREACLLVDAYLPGMNGLELLQHMRGAGHQIPSIMITGNSDVSMAVEAMKAGASDFIEKPIGSVELIASVGRALEQARDSGKLVAWQDAAADHMAGLTARQRQIMDMVVAGHPSKNIAADLGISQRTVENHRAAIMERTGSKSIPALARLALAAAGSTLVSRKAME